MGHHCGLCGSPGNEAGDPITSMHQCPGCGEHVCDRHTGIQDPFEPHRTGQHRSEDADGEIWFAEVQAKRTRGERNYGREHYDSKGRGPSGSQWIDDGSDDV